MLVDPGKLSVIRDLYDDEIVRRVVSSDISIASAFDAVVRDLGVRICKYRIDEWYVATWQTASEVREIELFNQNGDFDRAAETDVDSRFGRIAIAARMDLVAVAAFCRVLDENADVFMDKERLADLYPDQGEGVVAKVDEILVEYICQELWFGDVGQLGAVVDRHQIVEINGSHETLTNGFYRNRSAQRTLQEDSFP